MKWCKRQAASWRWLGAIYSTQLQTTLIKSPVYFLLQQSLQVQAVWLVTMFPDSSSCSGPPWVAGSSLTDPPGPIRPHHPTTAEGNVCFWSRCHMIQGWQLAKVMLNLEMQATVGGSGGPPCPNPWDPDCSGLQSLGPAYQGRLWARAVLTPT